MYPEFVCDKSINKFKQMALSSLWTLEIVEQWGNMEQLEGGARFVGLLWIFFNIHARFLVTCLQTKKLIDSLIHFTGFNISMGLRKFKFFEL